MHLSDADNDIRFLDILAARKTSLSPSERRVADYVLQHPQDVMRMSINNLADAVGVSQPTVMRFVKSMGLARYPELKLRTGQSLVNGTPYVHTTISSDDTDTQVVEKIFDSSIIALTRFRHTIDAKSITKAVNALMATSRIDCYGLGSARILALEAQHKLMSFGTPVVSYDDTHLQLRASATLRPGDVALCFSHTGMVHDIVKIAKRAREAGATVIVATRPNSALARVADIFLPVDTGEDTEIYTPMTSRFAHGALIDMLTTLIALRGGAESFNRLRKIKESLADLRVNE